MRVPSPPHAPLACAPSAFAIPSSCSICQGFEEGSEEYEEEKDKLMDAWRDSYFERAKKRREREKKRNPQSGELGFAAQPREHPVPVHAPRFPFERTEQWMVLLIDQKEPRRLIGYQKLTQNTRKEKVQLKFLAPKEGTVQYEIHAMCSAYVGADKKKLMKKTVQKKREEASAPLECPSTAFDSLRLSSTAFDSLRLPSTPFDSLRVPFDCPCSVQQSGAHPSHPSLAARLLTLPPSSRLLR